MCVVGNRETRNGLSVHKTSKNDGKIFQKNLVKVANKLQYVDQKKPFINSGGKVLPLKVLLKNSKHSNTHIV